MEAFRLQRASPPPRGVDERDDLVRLAQYIIRNPFSVEKMHLGPDGTIIYRSGMNPKVNANFRIFTPLDFIAAITSHIPDKSFQLVRYYGWYSKKPTNGRRAVPHGIVACPLACRSHTNYPIGDLTDPTRRHL
ncbi:MAG: hypothetical protein EOL86_14615 [Deltaproteobacteria bacterium]|nr:hypothetical protein [Deltaproteobacteria bacterium]